MPWSRLGAVRCRCGCRGVCLSWRLRLSVGVVAVESQVVIRLPRNSYDVEGCHLLFLFYHASSKDVKTLPFAFGFLPITDEFGVMIVDSHYRVCEKRGRVLHLTTRMHRKACCR